MKSDISHLHYHYLLYIGSTITRRINQLTLSHHSPQLNGSDESSHTLLTDTNAVDQPDPNRRERKTTGLQPELVTGKLQQILKEEELLPNVGKANEDIGESKTDYEIGLMHPSAKARAHPAFPILYDYATKGCPVDCGPAWTPIHIRRALERGNHPSALEPEAVEALKQETQEKVNNKYARVVKWKDIKNNIPPTLKVSPVAMIPHKSKKYRTILDLSFNLRYERQKYESVNETTTKLAPPQAMEQLGKALRRIITTMANQRKKGQAFLFSKMDIKDGFWRLRVSEADAWNFVYVLPSTSDTTNLDEIELVVPRSLQMGWCESPPFFCAASETARDIIEELFQEGTPLPKHPLEHHAVPNQHDIPAAFGDATLIEVYVDDFIAVTNNSNPQHLLHLTRSMMHGIHAIFPPPSVTGHSGGDPISEKKLKQLDGLFTTRKEILGWIFDGEAFTMELPEGKADAINKQIRSMLKHKKVPLKLFQQVAGKIQHASLGLPGGRGLFSPIHQAMSTEQHYVCIHTALRQALQDWRTLIIDMKTNPTSVCQLVQEDPSYTGHVDACKIGVGGVWRALDNTFTPIVWKMQWPKDIQALAKEDTISINTLEAAGVLLHWLALEQAAPTLHHKHVAIFCDNSSAVSWMYKMSATRTPLAGFLLRAMGLRIHATKTSPITCTHIQGVANVEADYASRWNHPSNHSSHLNFLSQFNQKFPLPQNTSWKEFHFDKKLSSRVISCMRGEQLTLASWLRLPRRDCATGRPGKHTQRHVTSTPSSKRSHHRSETSWSQHSQPGSALGSTDGAKRSKQDLSHKPLQPSPRPSKWLGTRAPSTESQTNSPFPLHDALKE